MISLFSKKEKEKMQLKEQLKYWKKQLCNKNSKYSNFFCRRMINQIECKLENLKGGNLYGRK